MLNALSKKLNDNVMKQKILELKEMKKLAALSNCENKPHLIPDANGDKKSNSLTKDDRPRLVVTLNAARRIKKRKIKSHLILDEF